MSGPKVDAVEAGAEIGAALWGSCPLVDERRSAAALAWVRGSRRTAAAASSGEVEPALLLASLAADETATSPIAGVLERARRDLRLALAFLSRCKLTPPFDGGYEPKAEDALEVLGDVERALVAMTRAVYLEADAVALAIHAASRGGVPMATRLPDDYREDVPPSALELVGRELGADVEEVELAQVVARAWSLEPLGRDLARRLLTGLMLLQENLNDDAEDDGAGGAAPSSRGTARARSGASS